MWGLELERLERGLYVYDRLDLESRTDDRDVFKKLELDLSSRLLEMMKMAGISDYL
jgi:hypothetical protein